VVELVERDHQVQLGLSFARALPRACRGMREVRQARTTTNPRTSGTTAQLCCVQPQQTIYANRSTTFALELRLTPRPDATPTTPNTSNQAK
jgi:hypothetical protein